MENMDDTDTIIMDELLFYGYHGVMEEEKTLGQEFCVDLELYCYLKEAGEMDDLEKSVDYTRVYYLVKNIVEEEAYNLLEALAERIAGKILDDFERIKGVNVYVKKPQAPLPGAFDHVGVEIRRDRDD